MLRYAAAAVTSLMLLSGLAACGGEDSPPRAEPTRTATTPTTTPSPTPPTLPAAAKGRGAASAKAFVRHYIDVLNYATFTGDVGPLRSMAGRKCDSCRNIQRGIKVIYAHGGHVDGGAFRVTRLHALRHQGSNGVTVDAYVHFGPQRIYRQAHARPDRYKAGRDILTFILSREQHAWLVSESSRAS